MAREQEVARLIIRLQAETGQMKTELTKANRQISDFSAGAKKLLTGIGVGIGITALISQLKQGLSYLQNYNSEIEQSRLGIGSLVMATSTITDHTGRVLEGHEKLNAALEIGADLYAKIQAASLRTAATTPEIVDGFQAMIAPAKAAGLSLEQTADLSIQIVQAMGAMNIPMQQMRTQAEYLLRGEENIRATLMRNMQIRGEEVRLAKEQGRLNEFLSEKFESFAIAGERMLTTWKGLRTSSRDILSILTAAAQEPLFEAAKQALGETLDALMEVKDGTIVWGKEAGQVIDSVQASLEAIIETVKLFKTEVRAVVWVLEVGFQTLNMQIIHLFSSMTAGWYLVVGAVGEFLRRMDIVTGRTIPQLGKAVEALGEKQKKIAEAMAKQSEALAKAAGVTRPGLETAPKPVFAVQPMAELITEEQRKATEESIDKITQKIGQLRMEQEKLVNPVRASRTALELWIAEATKGAVETPELVKALGDLRAEFEALESAKLTQLKIEVVDKAALSKLSSDVQEAMLEIRDAYEGGRIDLERSFELRRQVLIRAAEEEERLLRARLARAVTEPERIEIQTEIEMKQSVIRRELIDLTREEERAVRELNLAVLEGQTVEVYQRAQTELQALKIRYEEGLATIQQYYSARRTGAEEIGTAELELLEKQLANARSQTEQVRLQTQILERRAELQREIAGLTADETRALREQSMEMLSIQTMYQGLRERAAETALGPIGQMRAQFSAELALLDEQHVRQLEMIRNLNAEKIRLGEEFYTKEEALAKVREAQEMERSQRLLDFARQVQLARLSMASQVAGQMGAVFDQLYEASGQRAKQFFYLSKAISLAQAIINVAEGVTKALAQGGIFGPAMAGLIMTTGAAQIGIIMGQMIAGAKEGGLITRGSGNERDDVPIRVSRMEYIQPRRAVEYYGVDVMEAIRRMVIPRHILDGYRTGPITRPMGGMYQIGGSVDSGIVGDVILQPPAGQEPPSVTVNVHNEGAPLEVERTEMRYNEREQVFDLWLREASSDMRKRKQIQNLLR